MIAALALGSALAAFAAPAAAPVVPPVRLGSALFFQGDLEGAVERWKVAREDGGGSREFDSILASALTALGKRELGAKRFGSAKERFAEALAIDAGNRELRRLELTAELAEQTGGLRTLRPEETDAVEELDRLLTAMVLMDPPVPSMAVAPPAPPPPSSSASPEAPAAETPAATAGDAIQAPAPTALELRRAQAAYDWGLERYYAGDYDKASNMFNEAVRLDPGMVKARRGGDFVRAALRRRDGVRRYEEALRAFYSGDLPAARVKFRETLELDPNNPKAREALTRMEAPPPPQAAP